MKNIIKHTIILFMILFNQSIINYIFDYKAGLNASNNNKSSVVLLEKTGNINATITASKTDVCKGETPQPTITFSASGGTAPYTFTYTENGTTNKKIYTTGSNNSVSVNISTSNITTYSFVLDSVAGSLETSVPVTNEKTSIKINNLPETPTIAADGATTFCDGLSVNLSSAKVTGYTYQWYRNSSVIPNANDNILNVQTAGTYKLMAKNNSGCSSFSNSIIITINNASQPILSAGSINTTLTTFDNREFFTRCTTTFPNSISVANSSTNIGNIQSYIIDWGDGSPSLNLSNFNTNQIHQYQAGFYNLTFSLTTKQGCTYSKVYGVFVGNNPSGGVLNPGNLSGCAPYSITFPITAPAENIPGTQYIIDFGDQNSVTYIHPNVPSSVTHTYTKSSCGNTPVGSNVANSFVVSYTITNPCYPISTGTVGPIIISTPPIPDFSISSVKACINQPISISNISDLGSIINASGCIKAPSFYWSITPNTGWSTTSNLGSNGGFPSDIDYWSNGNNNLSLPYESFYKRLFRKHNCLHFNELRK